MQSLLVASAILLMFTVQQGSAIQCFVCNSHKDANCNLDIPPDNLLKDCRQEYSSREQGLSVFCRKISQVIEFAVNGLPPDTRVIRTCGFLNQTSYNYCYSRAGFGGRQVVCSCDQDRCNGSGALNTSFLTLAASILCGFLLMFAKRV